MDKSRLYFTVGTAQSGKSTYCESWVKGPFCLDEQGQHPENVSFNYLTDEISIRRPRAIVSGDDFRRALHGHAYLPEAEGAVFAMMDVATRALLSRDFDVIVDETCTTPQTLMRYLRIDPDARPVFIETPVEECIRRAVKNGKPYLVEPIKRMAAQLAALRANFEGVRAQILDYLSVRQSQDVAI